MSGYPTRSAINSAVYAAREAGVQVTEIAIDGPSYSRLIAETWALFGHTGEPVRRRLQVSTGCGLVWVRDGDAP